LVYEAVLLQYAFERWTQRKPDGAIAKTNDCATVR